MYMKLLITPALKLTPIHVNELKKLHELFFIEDERTRLNECSVGFCLDEIEGVICNFLFLNTSLDLFPKLKVIQLTSVGKDRIDEQEIKKRGIKLFTAGAAYAVPMAEWALAKTLEICKHSRNFYRNQKGHLWIKDRNITELSGRKAVIIGFGNVGKNIAKRLRGFDVYIKAVDIFFHEKELADEYFDIKYMKKALLDADIIYLTLPLLPSTYHLFDNDVFEVLKKDIILINVSRGGLIDESALREKLCKGEIGGVALDVFEEEPLGEQSTLWDDERVLISPHNSFLGNGNENRLFNIIKSNLEGVI